MGETPSYKMPMPAKMGERGSAGGVGHQRADIRRAGNMPNAKTGGLVDQHGKAADGMTLQPKPHSSPTMPAEENGFAPDGPLPANPNDAQSVACDQPPIEQTTEKPEPVPTSAEPQSGGESDPVPGDADPGAHGAAESPGYASLLDEKLNHPVGYSGKTAR
jgi:hypothetical protein